LSANANMTWDIIHANRDKPWDWNGISRNPNITWDIIAANPNDPWDWYHIGRNPSLVTWEIIQSNQDKPWDWVAITQNPNITWDIICQNSDRPWNWNWIFSNPMTKGKEDFIRKRLQQWFSRSTLKEELMAKVWHPRNIHRFGDLDPDFAGFAVAEGEDQDEDWNETQRQRV
jgi:hypothetical protein